MVLIQDPEARFSPRAPHPSLLIVWIEVPSHYHDSWTNNLKTFFRWKYMHNMFLPLKKKKNKERRTNGKPSKKLFLPPFGSPNKEDERNIYLSPMLEIGSIQIFWQKKGRKKVVAFTKIKLFLLLFSPSGLHYFMHTPKILSLFLILLILTDLCVLKSTIRGRFWD